jgi:hypothetical protein
MSKPGHGRSPDPPLISPKAGNVESCAIDQRLGAGAAIAVNPIGVMKTQGDLRNAVVACARLASRRGAVSFAR